MTEITLFELKQLAKNLGIDKISAVKLKKLPEITEKFRKWLSLGYNGTMFFLNNNIEKREDPSLLLSNANTVIVVMQPYPANIKFTGELKMAKYALEEDYHISLKNKLNDLVEILEMKFGGNYYIGVDSSPIFEKDWAVISGLGWRGKNSLIINKDYGSYFNIGIIISDLNVVVEADSCIKEIATQCGSCNLCKTNCPTNAILDNYTIDARKCISYLTVEAKLSEDILLKKEIANSKYIFGCDVCQDVCPYNKKFINNNLKNIYITKEELYKLSNKNFNEKFAKSAVLRLRNNRLRRNLDNL